MQKCGWQARAYSSHSFAFIITPPVIKVGNFRTEKKTQKTLLFSIRKISFHSLTGSTEETFIFIGFAVHKIEILVTDYSPIYYEVMC